LKSDRFNYWKLRASWAKVGIDGSPYQLDTYYDTSSITGSVVARNIFNNPNLKPEKNANVEAGMDFSVLKNRLNFNFTLYQNMSENQIIRFPFLMKAVIPKESSTQGKSETEVWNYL
jgi:outer membrane receptor for ferrienterochelin and colicin